eukprot:gene11987-1933_t
MDVPDSQFRRILGPGGETARELEGELSPMGGGAELEEELSVKIHVKRGGRATVTGRAEAAARAKA